MTTMTNAKLTPEDKRALRKAGQAVANATEARDGLIRVFHSQGFTLRDIAEALGTITHSAVARIVSRSTPKGPETMSHKADDATKWRRANKGYFDGLTELMDERYDNARVEFIRDDMGQWWAFVADKRGRVTTINYLEPPEDVQNLVEDWHRANRGDS